MQMAACKHHARLDSPAVMIVGGSFPGRFKPRYRNGGKANPDFVFQEFPR
jgi:hypothetical protein